MNLSQDRKFRDVFSNNSCIEINERRLKIVTQLSIV